MPTTPSHDSEPRGCRYPNPRNRERRRAKRAGEQEWRREYLRTGYAA